MMKRASDSDIPIDAPCSICGGAVQIPGELGDPGDIVQVMCLNPECGIPDLRLNPSGALATYRRAKATAHTYGLGTSIHDLLAAGELQRRGVPPGPPPPSPLRVILRGVWWLLSFKLWTAWLSLRGLTGRTASGEEIKDALEQKIKRMGDVFQPKT